MAQRSWALGAVGAPFELKKNRGSDVLKSKGCGEYCPITMKEIARAWGISQEFNKRDVTED
jgi:hypothetical protein